MGRGVGLRLLETLCHRERGGKRDTRLLDVLKFVHTTLWKYLFGRQARDLEQSNAVRCHLPDAVPRFARGVLRPCKQREGAGGAPGGRRVYDQRL